MQILCFVFALLKNCRFLKKKLPHLTFSVPTNFYRNSVRYIDVSPACLKIRSSLNKQCFMMIFRIAYNSCMLGLYVWCVRLGISWLPDEIRQRVPARGSCITLPRDPISPRKFVRVSDVQHLFFKYAYSRFGALKSADVTPAHSQSRGDVHYVELKNWFWAYQQGDFQGASRTSDLSNDFQTRSQRNSES